MAFGLSNALQFLPKADARSVGFEVDNARTRGGTLVFVIGDVCGDCGGSLRRAERDVGL